MAQSPGVIARDPFEASEVPVVSETLFTSEARQTDAGREGLWSRNFLGLLVTQFLGAMNDNIFRWYVVWVGQDIVSERYRELTLSAGLALLVLPFVVLAAPAGYLADRFSKRSVIVGCKLAEVILMILGVAAVLYGSVPLMFLVLFLMGTHSAMFGPSKYGAIPEVVREDRISAANGLVGMTTILAIVLGTVIAGYLYYWTSPLGRHHWWLSAVVLVSVAGLGLATSLLIRPLRSANPARRFPINLATETYRDLAALASARPLLLAAVASALFWSVAGLCQLNVDLFANKQLLVTPEHRGPLLAILALGVGIGNVLAGVWSKGRIELGMVPFGAAGIAAGAMLLFTVPAGNGELLSAGYVLSCVWLFALGLAAGVYDVPLQSFLQHRSPPKSRGSVLAASNLLTFSGTLLASGVFILLSTVLQLSGRTIFLLAGAAFVPVLVCIVGLVPVQTLRFLFWMLTRVLYRVRIEGLENLPREGGAVLVCNHVTWIDGLMLITYCPRPIRMIVYADYIQGRVMRWLARHAGAIPIKTERRKSVVEAIRTAREAVRQGDLVCIFPEGGLTRTGHLRPFHPGFLSILKDSQTPVIPIYLGGFWGSIFSFFGGRFFWKLPRRVPYPVSILIGPPLRQVADIHQVRLAVEQLGVEAMAKQKHHELVVPRRLLRICRRNMRRPKVADSTGTELTGSGLLMRTLILRRLLRRVVLARDEQYVGLLLPPSVGAVLANAALALDRRIAVNLNYTASSAVLNTCIGQCGIRHVITSRRMIERFPLTIDAELVYLEDLKDEVTVGDKLTAALVTWLVPLAILERLLGLTRIAQDDLLTVIFTSGSTGQPKGVMLSQYNIGSNITAFNDIVDLKTTDVLLGILPFFHSFGYTVTLWGVLTLEPKVVYHYSPLEAKPIGRLCRSHGVTIIVAAPTFLRCYQRRCEPEDFAALEVVITGAEKLPPKLADEFQQKFGIRPVEGYGTTELSPIVSSNIPPSRALTTMQQTCKEGTVGLPVPGVSVKVVDPETGEDLGVDKPGMLLVTGPNVMQGYLGRPELTAEVLHGGWYVTGDIAVVDADGFIRITGRQSRFSKIGGEMVPHIRVEEAIAKVLRLEEEEEIHAVVTAVPDPRKGERLVVLHTGLDTPAEQICRRLADEGLPPLWIPSPDSFHRVDAIPVLGTGKLDLKRVKEIALEKAVP